MDETRPYVRVVLDIDLQEEGTTHLSVHSSLDPMYDDLVTEIVAKALATTARQVGQRLAVEHPRWPVG